MPGTLDKERPSYLNLYQKKKVHTVAKSDIMENISTMRRREALNVHDRNLVSEGKGTRRRPVRMKNDKDVKMDDEVEELIEMRKRVNILEKEIHNIKVKRDAGNRELKEANEELQELKHGIGNLEMRVKRNDMKTEKGDVDELVDIEDSAESENKVKTLEAENQALKNKLKRRDAQLKRMSSEKKHSHESSHSKEEKPSHSKDHKTSHSQEHKSSHSKEHKTSHGHEHKAVHSKGHKSSHSKDAKPADENGCSIQ